MHTFKEKKQNNKVIPPKVKIAKIKKRIHKSLILLKNYTGALETGKVKFMKDGVAKIGGLLSLSLFLEILKLVFLLFIFKSSADAYYIHNLIMLNKIKSIATVKVEAIKPDAEKVELVEHQDFTEGELGFIIIVAHSLGKIAITLIKIWSLK